MLAWVHAGKVSARLGDGAVVAIVGQGELLGEWNFWGRGNRGQTTSLLAETDAEVLLLDHEVYSNHNPC
jgi:hypothetical protein